MQSPVSWTVRGAKWRGLSALHPSKCLMNHLSPSPSLPPSTVSPALSLAHHLLFFPHFILVCPSLPLSCRLTDTAYWFRMSSECWRGRRRLRRGGRGGGGLICILFPSAAQPPSGLDQSSPNTSFVFSRSTFFHCLIFCNLLILAALFTWRDSSVGGGGIDDISHYEW